MQKTDVLMWLQRGHSAMLLLAIVPVFFTYSLMNSIHGMLGLGTLPASPINEYLTRSLSLVYVLHGAVCMVLTFDMPRYLPLMRIIAAFHFLFGLMVTGIDIHAKLPLYWIIGEGPMISLFGVFIFFFCGVCIKENELHQTQSSTAGKAND